MLRFSSSALEREHVSCVLVGISEGAEVSTLTGSSAAFLTKILAQVGSHLHPLAAHATLRLEEDSLRAPTAGQCYTACMYACMHDILHEHTYMPVEGYLSVIGSVPGLQNFVQDQRLLLRMQMILTVVATSQILRVCRTAHMLFVARLT